MTVLSTMQSHKNFFNVAQRHGFRVKFISVMGSFYNPHYHPSGGYGVANARGYSLLPPGGLHHTVLQL